MASLTPRRTITPSSSLRYEEPPFQRQRAVSRLERVAEDRQTELLKEERRSRGKMRRTSQLVAFVCVLTVCVGRVSGFYIPGVAPTEYTENGKLEIKASSTLGLRREGMKWERYNWGRSRRQFVCGCGLALLHSTCMCTHSVQHLDQYSHSVSCWAYTCAYTMYHDITCTCM